MARGYLPTRWRNLILPDGAMELIINLGEPQALCALDEPERRTIFRRSWISGERMEPILVDELGHVHLVGVRLRAGGGWPFLGIPAREFSGQVVELDSVLGPEINELRDRLGEKTTDDARFDLLEEWLLRRQRTPPTPAVTHVLRHSAGCSSGADRTDRRRNWHQSQTLLREFDRCVGLTPKTLARVCAFQRVIQSVGHKTQVKWVDTAANCGYYDQAHLIREFRAFSGLTPTDYLVKRGPFLNYLEV
jgi:hypothetical protein